MKKGSFSSFKKMTVRETVTLSAITAVAMILSYLESLLPPILPLPGAKIGLSNIATVFALYSLGWRSAVAVSLVRVLLSALLFGNAAALIYSLFGAVFALLFMILFHRPGFLSPVGVSVIGGVFHNVGQIIAAIIIMENGAIAVYLPPLLIVGTVAGVAVGIAAGLLVLRLKRFIKD